MKIEQVNKTGLRIFYKPSILFEYIDLIDRALGSNTYRAFHKIDKNKPGSSDIFRTYFKENSNSIIKEINILKNEKELDNFSNKLCFELRKRLKKNIDNRQLVSFNKIRKPVDIMVEHLVSMGYDFSKARNNLIKHLFLPLDSQMFQSNFVFSDSDILMLGLKRTFTFKDIKDEKHYQEVQIFLKEKSIKLKLRDRIFFDLMWNNRYKSNGENLFETNPK